jgi:hypothetical protein
MKRSRLSKNESGSTSKMIAEMAWSMAETKRKNKNLKRPKK